MLMQDRTYFDWCDSLKKDWLCRIAVGKRGKPSGKTRDINVNVVSALLQMTREEYIIDMYRRGYLIGDAKKDAEDLLSGEKSVL